MRPVGVLPKRDFWEAESIPLEPDLGNASVGKRVVTETFIDKAVFPYADFGKTAFLFSYPPF